MHITLIKELSPRFPTPTSKNKSNFALFKCFCGKEFESYLNKTKMLPISATSCGCKKQNQIKNLNRKHGESRSKLYIRRVGMISRCYNKNNKKYQDYGGRGITVCKEWLDSYEAYRDYMLSIGWTDDVEIDRAHNDGNYEPSNIRLATRSEQCQNTRVHKTNTSGYRGVRRSSKNRWRSSIWVNNKEVNLGTYDSAIEGAVAYNNYVDEHKTSHNKNVI